MRRIKNYETLARTPARRDTLDIIEAGLDAIDTAAAIRAWLRTVDLQQFRHIHLFGFGKVAFQAVAALEKILGGRAVRKTVLGLENATHPLPSPKNVALTEQLVNECRQVGPEDLALIVVSGGGSAMLCWPASECEQGQRLYAAASHAGLTIRELNVVRKHLSAVKGGGLMKFLSPAKVIGLIFSDVPGDAPDMVASGPTYFDSTTVADAQNIISQYHLGDFELTETPKDPALFERVTNIVLVSNENALKAMAVKARTLGYKTDIIAADMYDTPATLTDRFIKRAQPHTVMLGGGEARIVVTPGMKEGGRNQYVARVAMQRLNNGQLFASVASDGMDNGDCAGMLADSTTEELLFTGPTGSNVSDLMLLLTS